MLYSDVGKRLKRKTAHLLESMVDRGNMAVDTVDMDGFALPDPD